MAAIIYMLCTLTALACAYILLRSYMQQKYRLLLWSGLCFVGLFVNNLFLVVDRYIFPDIDLSTLRLVTGLIAISFLLYGLIWEDESI